MTYVLPTQTFPRTVLPKDTTRPKWPKGLISVGQSGIIQTRDTTASGVSWTESYNPLRPNVSTTDAAFYSTVENFQRNYTRFLIDHQLMRGILGSGGGTPMVNGTGQTGNMLITDGWSASQLVMRAGDIFTIAGLPLVYVVTQDATTDGSGNVTLNINPPLFGSASTSSPGDNAVLTVNTSPGLVLFSCIITDVTDGRAHGPGFYQGLSVTFRETNG